MNMLHSHVLANLYKISHPSGVKKSREFTNNRHTLLNFAHATTPVSKN